MQPEQKIIADWMGRQLEKKGWTNEQWAQRAGVSASTVSRAQQESYESVTAVLTLDKLAKAAGVPSILTYLEADTPRLVPSASVLTALFDGMLRGLDERCPAERRPAMLAEGLQAALDLLQRNPAIAESPNAIAATAEALTMRRHPQGTNT